MRLLLILEHNIIAIYIRCDVTKPVFGVSDKGRLNPVSSATETSKKIEISLVVSIDIILSNKRITKVLIRLHILCSQTLKTGFLALRPICS